MNKIEKIESVIKKYSDNNGIITNINDFILDLTTQYENFNEIAIILKEVFKYNQDRIKEVMKVFENESRKEFIKERSNKIIDEILVDKSGLDIDVSELLNKILSIKNNYDLYNTLNSISDTNILLCIKCKILEYITMYKNELLNININNEEKLYYQMEIDNLNNILDCIINYEKSKSFKSVEITQNKLIFLTDKNKVLFYKDLESIDQSEYPAFQSLLSSIIIGTFVGNKCVNKNNFKIPEVRKPNGERIIYDKISNNYYIILYTFCKNNNFIYETELIKRYNLYQELKKKIQEKITNNDIEFLNDQLKIQSEIMKKLEFKKGRNYNGTIN